ncbi:hypothetical protein SAMN05216582_11912 [Selenomonas ruminantium]|uniref:Uncharacterized protein n=1 Tax=Selenomonas ruminantium TaxID=971 RepID=A0A1M6VKA8_SELRU|nr:hypothetical protein SAMN05216582_11912 [Selenomonas ruminantium]
MGKVNSFLYVNIFKEKFLLSQPRKTVESLVQVRKDGYFLLLCLSYFMEGKPEHKTCTSVGIGITMVILWSITG